jgi:ubiquinone/menaquinone biosynthesis C-methylase UbiE
LEHAHSIVRARLEKSDARVIDLGTCAGGLLMAVAERDQTPIGIDIALRWLIIARKRLGGRETASAIRLLLCRVLAISQRNLRPGSGRIQ